MGDMGLKKFKNIENVLKNHVGRWYRLNKNLSEMALNFRTHYQQIDVKLNSMKQNIEERDKIIQSQRKDYETDKDEYENQLKVLESALANSIPRNKTLEKFGQFVNGTDSDHQIQELKKDLNIQEQQYHKLQNENQRLTANL